MLSSFGQQVVMGDQYAASLKDKGYDLSTTFQDPKTGVTVTHDDVAAAFESAYRNHRGEFLQRCGASNRENVRIRKQYKSAIKDDVKDQFHLSWATIGFGLLLTIIGGPLGFIVAVITVLFEYYLTKDLDGDKSLAAVMS